MAWGSLGDLGGTADGTDNQASLTHTVITTSPAAGDVVVVIVAVDNTTTTDTNSNDISSVTDSAGNTYTKAYEYTNGNGTANLGATVAVFYSLLTAGLTATSSTITANFRVSSSSDASGLTAWAFSCSGAGSTLTRTGTPQTEVVDAGQPGSLALSGLTSREYLFVRGTAVECGNTPPTYSVTDANWTEFAEASVGAPSTGGMCAFGEWQILTGTGATSDTALNTGWDLTSVFFALAEDGPAGGFLDPFGMYGIYGI